MYHPHLNSEELRRTPKEAKFHLNGVVPMAFFRQAVENPDLFLQSVDHSQIGSEESAHSPSNGDHQKPTSVTLSVSVSGPSQSGIEGNSRPSPPSDGTGDQTMSASTSSPSGKEDARVRRFGWYSEALLRDCYTDLMQEINDENEKRNKRIDSGGGRTLLLEIRGSAGIGKSAFLAYLMAVMKRSGLKDFALFHAPKVGSEGSGRVNEMLCSVWIDGKLEMDSVLYDLSETRRKLQTLVPKLEAMSMDGCSMGFSIEDFVGVIFVAASPSVSTENLQKALGNNYTTLYMPPWSLDESPPWRSRLGAPSGVSQFGARHPQACRLYRCLEA
jgi:hypothetical protein